jgi:hypothetical protein
MPKAVAAEWFLRLFTTPDRAGAIAGDMSEEGRVSWFDLLRTVAALFLRNVAVAPFRFLLLVLCGAIVSIASWELANIPVRLRYFWRFEPWVLGTYSFAIHRILGASLIGYLLVRLAKGRDITACLAYAVISSALLMALNARALWYTHRYSAWHLALGILFSGAVPACFLVVSGVYTRKRFLNRA